MFRVSVLPARPEKSPQSISFAARYDVNVQMRDALADPIVDGDERSLGLQRRFHSPAEQLRSGEKWLD